MTERIPLPASGDVQRIACLMLNGIGDILCVTPALAALRGRYPEARISLVLREHLRGLVEGSPFVDDLVYYGTGGIARRWRFLRELRRRRFDLWVDLHVPTFNTVSSNGRDFFRNALLLRAAKARYCVGYAVPQLIRLLTHPVPLPSAEALTTVNVADTTLALVDPPAGIRFRKSIPVTERNRAWAATLLPARTGARVALFFGSRQAADLWPTPHVRAFVELAAESLADAEFVLVGGEHERDLVDSLIPTLRPAVRERLRSFVCAATLSETAALLERCDALVTTDSGPMHIADAVGVPMVALFSSKNYYAIWQPRDAPARVLNRAIACGPCFRATCPIGNRCMDMIEPPTVLDELRSLLLGTARQANREGATAH